MQEKKEQHAYETVTLRKLSTHWSISEDNAYASVEGIAPTV